MNESVQNKLSEVAGANNIAYILNDHKDFSLTGYKVMQNQGSFGLLRCAKIMYNGKIKLVYLVDGYKPLSYAATRLGVNELNAVIHNLIQRAMDIKANGFFRAENLELDFNKIFVDMSDHSVHLIYFPLASGGTGKMLAFENEFRIALIRLFNAFPVFGATQFQRLCSDLANGSLPLEVILRKVQENMKNPGYDSGYARGAAMPAFNQTEVAPVGKGYQKVAPVVESHDGGYGHRNAYREEENSYARRNGYREEENAYAPRNGYREEENAYPPRNQYREEENVYPSRNQYREDNTARTAAPAAQVSQPALTVTAINSPFPVVLTVDKAEYLIGKNPDMVDGAVTYNPAISRCHCKISFRAGKYYLTDLGSANGTFINRQRVKEGQELPINSGDYLNLANSEFIISF